MSTPTNAGQTQESFTDDFKTSFPELVPGCTLGATIKCPNPQAEHGKLGVGNASLLTLTPYTGVAARDAAYREIIQKAHGMDLKLRGPASGPCSANTAGRIRISGTTPERSR
jgi:hypothetical protein